MRVIANRGLRNSDTLSVLIVPVREQIPGDSVQDHAIRAPGRQEPRWEGDPHNSGLLPLPVIVDRCQSSSF
jgi:hypothetical protein